MLKIRLSRFGKKNAPSYRIVVKEARSKRDGDFVDQIGYFDQTSKNKLSLDKKLYEEWIKKGAKPTEAVLEMLKGNYTIEKYNPKVASAKIEKPSQE